MICRDGHETVLSEFEPHRYSAFASDLYDFVPELRTGWPEQIDTELGNGEPFIRTAKKVNAEGEIESVRYDQRFGCISLRIFND